VAIRRYEEMLARAEAALPPNDPVISRPLIGLATVHLEMGLFGRAEELYRRAIDLLEETRPLETRALAFSIGGLADCLLQQGHLAQAEPLYRRAIALLEEQPRTNLRELGAMVGNLASVKAAQGHYAEARPLYARSLDLLGKAYGPKHVVIARLLAEQAQTYAKLGHSALARSGFEEAIALGQELHAGDPELARTLSGYAALLVEEADYAQAEPLLRRAVAIHEANDARDAVGLGRSLSNLGHLYASQQRLDEAQAALRRSLELLEPRLAASDPFLLETQREHDLVERALELRGVSPAAGL
jgi:tetratricopeptide (TPR) repeat protein